MAGAFPAGEVGARPVALGRSRDGGGAPELGQDRGAAVPCPPLSSRVNV